MKIVLNEITNANNLSNINSNFTKIEEALNEDVLYRDNPEGEPNQMNNLLDMNGHAIINVGEIDTARLVLNGQEVAPTEIVVANSLKKDNNLSDVTNVPLSRQNLGLGNVNNTADVDKPVSTAQQAALDLKMDKTGGVFSGPITVPGITNKPTVAGNVIWDSGNLDFTQPPAIGATAPNTGRFTTLTATGVFTPTGGIAGKTDASNAAAGNVGEYLEGNNTTGTAMSNGVAITITTITLTPGDWDVSGSIFFNTSNNNLSNVLASISSTNNTLGGFGFQTQQTSAGGTIGSCIMASPVVRYNVTVNTPIYLIGYAQFAAGTCTGTGRIRARRVR